MKRPMSLLCPVEMEPSEETQETPLHRSPDITDLTTVETSGTDNDRKVDCGGSERPQRKAATAGETKRRLTHC